MIRNAILNTLIVVVFLLAPISANAILWHVLDTAQNGAEGALGFGANVDAAGNATTSATLGLVGWFTVGVNGGGNQIINARGIAPSNDYNCYGLATFPADQTCTSEGETTYWSGTSVVWSGSGNSDGSFLDLSWTGIVGSEIPFGVGESLFVSGVNSGSYDASGNISGGVDLGAGYDADGFVCWNNPANGLPADGQGRTPDFCGNATGTTATAPASGPQTKFNRELPLGITLFTDNGDYTFTIDMADSTYSDCVADAGCTPGSNSSDVFAQWRMNLACATADGLCCGGVDTEPCPQDTDGDSLSDTEDNCTLVANPIQRDTDGDDYGNLCDADLDGSLSVNFNDLVIFKGVFNTADPDADFNGDNAVNFSDLVIFKGLFNKPPGPSGLAP